jgi:hypothetical protein
MAHDVVLKSLERDSGEMYLPPEASWILMSTILLAIRTPEGIVLASDGRKCGTDGEILSEDVQKIFPIERSKRACLAYGLAGTTKLGSGSELVFDFVAETALETARLSADGQTQWWQYLSVLTDRLCRSLNAKRKRPLNQKEETYLLVAGLYGKHVKSAHIVFRHDIDSTEAEPVTHQPGYNPKFGSRTVLELIDKDNSYFSKYAEPKRETIRTIRLAIDRALADVHAHCDPEALNVEENTCRGIGGRIQIATITFTDGFKWVPEYEPAGRQ